VHGSGSAGRESGGRPKGTVSTGLLQSPFEQREAGPPELAGEDWSNAFDWYSFVCSGCGDEVYVAHDLDQALESFALMCHWIHGEPPICSECLIHERGLDRDE
jgi:hypothetical protein